MNRHKWKLLLGLGLVFLSAIFYGAHFLLFHDWHHIAIYLLGDIAFVPLEVLLVTLILHELLDWRERRSKLQKMNMAISVFFAGMGAELLKVLCKLEASGHAEDIDLAVSGKWTDKQFRDAKNAAAKRTGLAFSTDPKHLEQLQKILEAKRGFLLSLLENPNLLEHESFTDVLWAVFHLTDELGHREDLSVLPETDRRHLTGDMERAFTRLLAEWISYMQHLKNDYPYLFSLAVRTNPFVPTAEVTVNE